MILRFELEEIVENNCEHFKDFKSRKASNEKYWVNDNFDFATNKDGTTMFGRSDKSYTSNNMCMIKIPIICIYKYTSIIDIT